MTTLVHPGKVSLNSVYACDLAGSEGRFAPSIEAAFADELPICLVARPAGACFHLVPRAAFPGAGSQSAVTMLMVAKLLPSSPARPAMDATPFIAIGPGIILVMFVKDVSERSIPLSDCTLPVEVRGYVLESIMRAITV